MELDRARFELDEMNKILASKNSERKDLRGRVQRLEQQLDEKDQVRGSGAGGEGNGTWEKRGREEGGWKLA